MVPESIVDHRASEALEFRWSDGTRYLATYKLLRSSCPCADCKALRAAGRQDEVGTIQLKNMQPVGAYGVQFFFSDGHYRGIFPWIFLKDLLEKSPI
ncbi:DUF971 domain-containing protein [Variovorax sp. V35]